MRIILFLLLSAVIMVNCSSPVRSIEEVVAMDPEVRSEHYDNICPTVREPASAYARLLP